MYLLVHRIVKFRKNFMSHELEEACIVPIVTLNITKDFGSVMVPFALAQAKESSLVSSGPSGIEGEQRKMTVEESTYVKLVATKEIDENNGRIGGKITKATSKVDSKALITFKGLLRKGHKP
ncbi:hypothetical protein V6N11_080282 [Hibiscus sabdariffa]|uniref:Uncharacterized protein n=1 Tax=Hibiscus sabdariffa TaxID=183260 RepID=A0ABR2R794_9ROSI